MNNDTKLILDKTRQLTSKNKKILKSTEPEKKKLREEHDKISNLLRAEVEKHSSSSNTKG